MTTKVDMLNCVDIKGDSMQVYTKASRLLSLNPIKGRSLMAHIRRTRHIMMPSHRSCFSYSVFASQNKPSHLAL